MKFAELKSALKIKVSPVYFIFGTDFYLASKSVELITNVAGVKDSLLDVSTLNASAGADVISTQCRTSGFFGGRRVVVVKDIADETLSQLKNYITSPNADCILILISSAEKAPTIKNMEIIDCNPMPVDLLIKLIANALAKSGKQITTDSASLLCHYCANMYGRIDGELNKIINFFDDKNLIGTDEINQIVAKTEEYQIYELSNAICSGNISRAEEILKTLQNQGVEDYAIFGNLVSTFRRIFYSLSCKSSNDTVASVLGCSPYAVNYARRDYKNLSSKIANIYENLLDLEYQIKSGKISVNNAVVLCYALV